MLKRYTVLFAASIVAATCVSTTRAALLWQLKFDEASSGNTTATDTGTGTAANGTFSGTATRTSNTPGGFSLGAMSTGSAGATDYVTGGDASKLDALATMTVTGWINIQGAIAQNDRLVSKLASVSSLLTGWDLRFTNAASGQLSFTMTNSNAGTPSANSTSNLSTAAGWQFFAVSYDGTNIRYFTGSPTVAASQLGGNIAAPSGWGTPADTTADVRVGSTAASASDRTPTAFFDDIRVYDTAMTTAAQLETIRLENAPEPTAISLAAIGAGGLLLRRRSRCGQLA